ncbi:metallophosphoesterase, partial [Prevotella sp.]
MRTVNIRILHTSDIHGCLFPFDFLHGKEATGSLSRAYNYIKSRRKTFGKNLLLIDSGDILQGQPTFYLSNFINTEKPNLAASVYNYMQYDCVTIGNHDIETGHLVYDKFNKELDSPLLAANIICTRTGRPYFKPYTVIEREGVRIAIIGMTTPTVPYWLNEELWQGMR